jgi:hypothetical protein
MLVEDVVLQKLLMEIQYVDFILLPPYLSLQMDTVISQETTMVLNTILSSFWELI